ncbi:MAG: ABC transporter ATP-binding protein [Bacteroidales bacterium]|nr:ABC transporter ATP-binding protein [Bacteroidales bacterium]
MRQAFRLIWQCDRRGFLLKLFYTICTSLLPLVNLYVLKLLVDGVTTAVATDIHDTLLQQSILNYVLLFCAIMLLTRWIGTLNTVNNDILTQRLTDYINNIIQTQSVQLDLSYYDNPDYHDTFHRAQQEAAFRPIRILENMVAVVGSAAALTGIAAMLLVASWQVVAVMLVAVLPSFAVRLYKSRRIYRFRRETTQDLRRTNYYGQLLTNRTFAKEVRAFGLADHFRRLYVEIRARLVRQLLAISRRMALFDALTALFETAAMALVLIFLIRPAISGAMTIGSFVMLFEAFRRGQGYLGSLVGGVSGLYEHKLFINNLFEFLELKPSILSPAEPVPFPDRVENISFDDVTFSYPGMKQPVLSHFSLTAKRGAVTLIEGENGRGKTTMLKLLLRLYDPQEGSIRINDIDIRRFDVGELRHNISVIFQDYVQFCFTARENITFGDIKCADDARRLAEAMQMADAETVVSQLGKGLDTPLGRQFDGGEELSMGQGQRIALARQLYSNAQILLFDEPTAWMDPDARNRFSQTLTTLTPDHIILLVQHTMES